MKKWISLLLTSIMMVSFIPVIEAEGTSESLTPQEAMSSVFFASDYQFFLNMTPSLYGDESITSCKPIIENFASMAKNKGYDLDGVIIGGDYTQNDSRGSNANPPLDPEIFGENLNWHYGNNPNPSIAEIKTAFKEQYEDMNDESFIFVQGNHDPDVNAPNGENLSPTGAYEFEDYIVYVLNDEDYVGPRPRTQLGESVVPGSMTEITDADGKVAEVAAELETYLNGLIAKNDNRPVFICSHQPVHYAPQDYNGNGYQIFEVENKAAEKLDIIHFFAHTHKGIDDIGGGLAYIAKGVTMKVADSTAEAKYTEKTTNFTYLNYGFLARYEGDNNVVSASIADITNDNIIIKRYRGRTGEVLQEYSIPRSNAKKLLTQPFLQLPKQNSVNVVWFTEFEGSENYVMLYKNGLDAEPVKFEAETTKLSRVRNARESEIRPIYRHEATVTGLPEFTGDSTKVDYKVKSDAAVSEMYKLQASPKAGTDMKILLTSDSQLKDMTPANMQKIEEKYGKGTIDAVFFAGDLVNYPDAANEWFDDNGGGAFFPSMQGYANKTYPSAKGTYKGGSIIQYAPMYTAIGNHEVTGRYSENSTPQSEFNDPATKAYAEALYNERNSDDDPSNDIAIEDKEAFIQDNSFNTVTYEELFSLPTNDKGNERYYAETIGDVRLVVLEVARIWRDNGIGYGSKYSEKVGATGATDPDRKWGSHIFESIAAGSDQYKWLENELASNEFNDAKYKVVMFHHQFHSLGGNVVPAYTDPIEKVVTTKDGKSLVLYEYPLENDQMVGIEPLLENAGVDLILNGHSHLWNRFITKKGTNVLETSNVGNTYEVFLDLKSRTYSAPAAFAENSQYNYLADQWNKEDYVLQGDPYGLSPIMPSIAPYYDNPYIESNTVTSFSVFDTKTGIIDSYYYNTDDPDSEVIHFDSFSIAKNNIESYTPANKLTETVSSAADADNVVYGADKKYVYALNKSEKSVSVYLATQTSAPLKTVKLAEFDEVYNLGDICDITYDTTNKKLAVSESNGRIFLLDSDCNFVSHIDGLKETSKMKFTSDGTKFIAVHNDSSVSVFDMTTTEYTVTSVSSTEIDAKRNEFVQKNVIIEKDKAPSEYFKADDIKVSADGKTAYILFGNANAIGVFDVESCIYRDLYSFGYINNLVYGNEIDLDTDGEYSPTFANTRSIKLPTSIELIEKDNKTYIISLNNGSLADSLKTTATINENEVSVVDSSKLDGLPNLNAYAKHIGKTNNAKFIDGANSLSVYEIIDTGLEVVFESGNLVKISNKEDSRAFDFAVNTVDDEKFAYISFSNGVGVYDITDLNSVKFFDFKESKPCSVIVSGEVTNDYTNYSTVLGLTEDSIIAFTHRNTKKPSGGTSGVGSGSSNKNNSTTNKNPDRLDSETSGTMSGGASFSDVAKTDWFYDAVNFVYKNNLFKGTDENTFSPLLSMTRGMIATVLSRFENADAEYKDNFSDVSTDDYFAKAVAWASENGIVFGTGDNTFDPAASAKRQDFAVMVYRYAAYKGVSTEDADEADSFADAESIDDYAKDALDWAVRNKILMGDDENKLNPADDITRAEAAIIFMRLSNLFA